MIKIYNSEAVNPKCVARVEITEENESYSYKTRYRVTLFSGSDNTITRRTYDTREEADNVFNYVCDEIDKTNNQYKEENNNEQNIN